LVHKYVYGDVPPVVDAAANPSDPPKQLTLSEAMIAIAGGFVLVTTTIDVSKHPLASV
jgi:hypothetical protein